MRGALYYLSHPSATHGAFSTAPCGPLPWFVTRRRFSCLIMWIIPAAFLEDQRCSDFSILPAPVSASAPTTSRRRFQHNTDGQQELGESDNDVGVRVGQTCTRCCTCICSSLHAAVVEGRDSRYDCQHHPTTIMQVLKLLGYYGEESTRLRNADVVFQSCANQVRVSVRGLPPSAVPLSCCCSWGLLVLQVVQLRL